MQLATNQRGFTLTEMLLSVAIISILAGLSFPLYQSFQARNELDVTAQSMASMLRRGQTYARGVSQDSTWSIRYASNTLTLFKGTTYASRDASFDEIIAIPTFLTVTGPTDITFAKLSAHPSVTGSYTLTSNNESRTVTLNAHGMVTY